MHYKETNFIYLFPFNTKLIKTQENAFLLYFYGNHFVHYTLLKLLLLLQQIESDN